MPWLRDALGLVMLDLLQIAIVAGAVAATWLASEAANLLLKRRERAARAATQPADAGRATS